MMKFTTIDDGVTITWDDGLLGGDEEAVTAVYRRVAHGEPSGWNYWDSIPPSVRTEWDAYLTIGATLIEVFALTNIDITVDPIPENPDGYQAEGPIFDEEDEDENDIA
jgi:hypothetical protein